MANNGKSTREISSPSGTRAIIDRWLRERLDARGLEHYEASAAECARGPTHDRFCALISLSSRFAGQTPLGLSGPDCERANQALQGWNPERWTLLEALRVGLVLAREDLAEAKAKDAMEEAFRYADMGELCALYRSLTHLPGPERFVWRAGEGCRTNMRAVFEAVACDTPYPVTYFDDNAWNQAVVKCIFIEAPLWRFSGLDSRLSPELARIALDLADERRSAGRPVQHELWLCLGEHAGERGLASIERELCGSYAPGRRAAAIALARAGANDRLAALCEQEADQKTREIMQRALTGETSRLAFRALDPILETAQ